MRPLVVRRRSARSDAIGPLLPLLVLCLTWGCPALPQGAFVNFEGKQTSPVRLSPDGSRLFAVNTPDARLSVFDVSNPLNPILMAEVPVGMEPVSVHALDSEEVWVVNEVSDSVSVVSVSQGVVLDTIHVPDEPADLVFAGGRAFISAARRNQIAVVDVATHEVVTNLNVLGENPRALAVRPDGGRVYAAFALSGNRTTIVPPDRAPAPSSPTNPELPPAPQVGLIVDAADSDWSGGPQAAIPYAMPDYDLVEIDPIDLSIVRYVSRVGTVLLGLAVDPGSGDLWVANTEARNLVQFEPNLRGNFLTNRVSRVRGGAEAIDHFDLNPGFTYADFPNQAERQLALAQPTALAFNAEDNTIYVAAFGSDRVARMDSAGQILNRIELNPEAGGATANPRTKRGPRGLALKPAQALYVLNRIANTLSVVDPKSHAVVREIPVGSHDPTPPVIRLGRGFLYDAKLSGSGTVSCASCHVDGEMDMIAWDLGDPGGVLQTNRTQLLPGAPVLTNLVHPMKGPMVTQTLRGLQSLDPLHWRGDRTNFLHFNGAFDSILGGGILSAADMEIYRAFINSLVFHPNPNQNLDRTLPTAFPTKNGLGNAAAGRDIFMNDLYQPQLTCNTCHALPTGSAKFIVPAAALEESQDFKVPHLRNVYKKLNVNFAPGAQSVGGYGIIHDGIDPDLFTFLSRRVFGVFANDTVRKRNLDAFVQCFDTGTAPAVGFARTISAANLADTESDRDWTVLENQALVRTNIDLVAHGILDGRRRGLTFHPDTRLYRADRSDLGPFTREQLMARIRAGGRLTFMGVPPGSGVRMGIDRDQDAVPDGDQPAPRLQIRYGPAGAVVSWPTNAPDYVLERSEHHPLGVWHPDTQERGMESGSLTVTNTATVTNRFFRLRKL